MNFKEFVSDRDIRFLVIDAIEGDPNSAEIDQSPLANYENREDILTYPALQNILSNLSNRGDVIQMVKRAATDSSITVNTLVQAIVDGQV